MVRYGKTPLQAGQDLEAAMRDGKRSTKLVFVRGEARMSVKVRSGPMGLRTGDL